MGKWAKFNGCKGQKWVRKSATVAFNEHYNCAKDVQVLLILIDGGGHTWPGTNYSFEESQFGHTTQQVDANEVMWHFFSERPMPSDCHTAVEGEACFRAVQWAMQIGLTRHPEWRKLLTSSSRFEEFQDVLHDGIYADCPKPCQATTLSPRIRWSTTPTPSNAQSPWTGPSAANSLRPKTPSAVAMPSITNSSQDPSCKQECGLQGIQGRWTHRNDPGMFVEVVEGNKLHWDGGPTTKLVPQGMDEFATQWEGSHFHARLVGDQVIWADGDVWIHTADAPKQQNKHRPAFMKAEVKEENETANGSLSLTTRGYMLLMAGIVATFAVAALMIMRAYQRAALLCPVAAGSDHWVESGFEGSDERAFLAE